MSTSHIFPSLAVFLPGIDIAAFPGKKIYEINRKTMLKVGDAITVKIEKIEAAVGKVKKKKGADHARVQRVEKAKAKPRIALSFTGFC